MCRTLTNQKAQHGESKTIFTEGGHKLLWLVLFLILDLAHCKKAHSSYLSVQMSRVGEGHGSNCTCLYSETLLHICTVAIVTLVRFFTSPKMYTGCTGIPSIRGRHVRRESTATDLIAFWAAHCLHLL